MNTPTLEQRTEVSGGKSDSRRVQDHTEAIQHLLLSGELAQGSPEHQELENERQNLLEKAKKTEDEKFAKGLGQVTVDTATGQVMTPHDVAERVSNGPTSGPANGARINN